MKESVNFVLSLSSEVSLTGSWRVPVFVVVVLLLIVGSQEKPAVPGKGKVIDFPVLTVLTSVDIVRLLEASKCPFALPHPLFSLYR